MRGGELDAWNYSHRSRLSSINSSLNIIDLVMVCDANERKALARRCRYDVRRRHAGIAHIVRTARAMDMQIGAIEARARGLIKNVIENGHGAALSEINPCGSPRRYR